MQDTSAKSVLEAIREPGAFGGAPGEWDAAMAAMPAGLPPFLDRATLSARRAAAGLPTERDALLGAVAAEVAQDLALRRFAWYLHWRVFEVPERGAPWGAPSLVGRLGQRAGLFYELLSLEFAPRLAAWHAKLGYPSSVTAQTVRQIPSFENNHLRGRGFPGIYENQFPWLAAYLTNRYVRLGRFEYMLAKHYGVSAWRRNRDGRVLALADDGTRVGEDGLCLPANAPAGQGWLARQQALPGTVVGFPIDPAGYIRREEVRLATCDWTPCLQKGATVLDLHIPAGGGMDWEAVSTSFAQALEFFDRHHPEEPFTALVCRTWFLDPRLAGLLPADANILRFQRAGYLTPVAGPDGLWFVFLRDATRENPATLPRDTALRRTLADFLARGGTWNGGGMFLMREDMAHPREGAYGELSCRHPSVPWRPADGKERT